MKSVFITGGTTGIGLALAKYYLANGHRVGICGRDKNRLEDKSLLTHPHFSIYELDVSDREKTKKVISDFAGNQGLDLMIANAGISVGNKTQLPNFDKAQELMKTNVFGVMNSFEAALEIMLKQKRGHLAGVSSVSGFVGLPGAAPYSASKAAVIKMCESFRIDLAQFNIRVSVIAPGFVDTPLTQKNHHPMPFMISADKAAAIIAKRLEKNHFMISFPWPMYLITRLMEIIPRRCYFKLMSLKIFNYSKKSY
ncbi:MAG: SDR family NAD(P)-dependent oxidoreductase [Bacteriovoracaceae bacterium]|nr:SDR family NAD(P)-dependent oxidoreductase [Bacteriovoracaceae bacterium]